MSHAPATTVASPPASGLVDAAVAAFKAGDWAIAAEGFLKVHTEMGAQTPRPIFAQAATALHKLGRYAEAEKLAFEGLGEQRDLITQKAPVPTEEVILRSWSKTPAPVVTILCTTYNHERYIAGAIRGFLSQQTKFSFEILIHDDASTDGTQAVIRHWQKKYPSIIRSVLQTENQTSRGVRPTELLWKLARGKYVAHCEGDDYWLHPLKLAKQVGFLEQHSEFSCSAHNHYLYCEADLSVRPWIQTRRDLVLSQRQLMNLTRLLWLPTVVYRRTFTAFPPERDFAATGDFFLTSYLGTFGKCAYLESFLGSVRRQNQHSSWTPLAEEKKNYFRVKTWVALVRMHENLGNLEAASDLMRKIQATPLNDAQKSTLITESLKLRLPQTLKAS
jgi:glycosyltransferase involved in cell wall biosynthesis